MDPGKLDEFEEEPSKVRKIFLAALAVLLILLVASFLYLDSLVGIVSSQKAVNNSVQFASAVVIFENQTLQRLQKEYLSNQEREIKACLMGKRDGSKYVIESIYFPSIVEANAVHIMAGICPTDVIIDLHSHPINKCLASEQDISVYSDLKKTNSDLRMMVMCSTERFALV